MCIDGQFYVTRISADLTLYSMSSNYIRVIRNEDPVSGLFLLGNFFAERIRLPRCRCC